MTLDRNKPTISFEFAGLLVDWLNRESFGDRELVSRILERKRKERIDQPTWQKLLSDAQALRPDAPVGLHIGMGIRAKHVGTLGYLVLNSETLAEALETYLHCEHQFYGINFASMHRGDDRWRVFWRLENHEALSVVVDVAFGALYSFMCQRFGSGCRLLRADFPGAAPGDIEPYHEYFGCPVSFGSEEPGLMFALGAGQQQIPLIGTGDFAFLRAQQDQAFDQVLPASDSFLRTLRHKSLRLLPFGEASLTHVAADMHLTPRTLQRRLAAYNMRYQELLDGLREQLAIRYLIHSELSLAQLSQLVGFSEQSAFQRAFKNWTGVTPGNYRQPKP